MLATAMAALSGDAELMLFPALWGLGLGWNFGLIGGSSLVTESVAPEPHVAVQGTADLLMSFCGGLAGFSSGFIRHAVGFHMLANVAAVAALAMLVIALRAFRHDRLGARAAGPLGLVVSAAGPVPTDRGDSVRCNDRSTERIIMNRRTWGLAAAAVVAVASGCSSVNDARGRGDTPDLQAGRQPCVRDQHARPVHERGPQVLRRERRLHAHTRPAAPVIVPNDPMCKKNETAG